MNRHDHTSGPGGETIRRAAVEWLARRDRGMSDAEARRFEQWLAADRAHAAAFAAAQSVWGRMDRLATDPVFDAEAEMLFSRATRRRRRKWMALSAATLAAAASLAIVFFTAGPSPRDQHSASLAKAPLPTSSFNSLDGLARVQELPDGSVVELNGDSVIEVEFSPAIRNVRLVRGEAHFSVAKNPDRPFVVTNRSVAVRAVGTAFNVRVDGPRVDVIVTEGTVALEGQPSPDRGPEPRASAGTRAVIALESAASAWEISKPTPAEIEEFLAWRAPRLNFSSTPLAEVVAAFNRHNRHQLRLGDASLESRTLTGSFRANNLPGFIRLLQSTLAVEADQVNEDETVLRPAR